MGFASFSRFRSRYASCVLAGIVSSRIVKLFLEIIIMSGLAVEVLILAGRVTGLESEARKPGRLALSLFGEFISVEIWSIGS